MSAIKSGIAFRGLLREAVPDVPTRLRLAALERDWRLVHGRRVAESTWRSRTKRRAASREDQAARIIDTLRMPAARLGLRRGALRELLGLPFALLDEALAYALLRGQVCCANPAESRLTRRVYRIAMRASEAPP